jgi:hypothetical protein
MTMMIAAGVIPDLSAPGSPQICIDDPAMQSRTPAETPCSVRWQDGASPALRDE